MNADKPNNVQELSEEELSSIVGGETLHKQDGRCYEYVGDSSDEDWNSSYLCPICGRPVHYGSWFRFYCDPCNKSWLIESKLRLNTASHVWKQIPWSEYERKRNDQHTLW